MTILPVELIEEVVNQACRVESSASQHAIFLSALASVCAHFRHRVNRKRFEDVPFFVASSPVSAARATKRLAQLEGLINADESVWGKGDDEPSESGLAQHIRSFAVDMKSTEDHIRVILGDGAMARIMRKLFRPQREAGEPSNFSLSCTVRHKAFNGSDQLRWTCLKSEFIEAFRYMCTTSSLSSLSLHGFHDIPPHDIIHESVIRDLHIQAISFSKKTEEEHSGVPSRISQLISLSACLWYIKEQDMLYDILDVIPKLEKLCIHIGPTFSKGEPVAFNRDLPYLQELVIELEPSMDSAFRFTSPSPTAFILGTQTPPTVHRIEVHVATYLKNFAPRDDFMEQFRSALDFMNLPILEQQLQSLSVLHTAVKHIQFVLAITLPSFPDVDSLTNTNSQQKMTEMVSALFPLLLDSNKVEFFADVAIYERRGLWPGRSRNYGI